MTADLIYMKLSWTQCIGYGLFFAWLCGVTTATACFVWTVATETMRRAP